MNLSGKWVYAGRKAIQSLLEEEGMKDFDIYPHEAKRYVEIREKLLDIIRKHS